MGLNEKIKVLALPFSGATKYSYNSIHSNNINQFEWISYELPGRGERINEPFLQDTNSIINDILEKTSAILNNHDYIIYGHSLGTLLGYELIKKIIALNIPSPLFLFFTGRGAPSIQLRERYSNLSDASFWLKVDEIGGTPKEVLQNEELKSFLGPILRSDFKIAENYTFKKVIIPLSVPLFLGFGSEELIGENKTDWNAIMAWQSLTSQPIHVDFFEGNHFFIFKHQNTIIKKLQELSLLFQKEKPIKKIRV